jgi:hypothetical protein
LLVVVVLVEQVRLAHKVILHHLVVVQVVIALLQLLPLHFQPITQ